MKAPKGLHPERVLFGATLLLVALLAWGLLEDEGLPPAFAPAKNLPLPPLPSVDPAGSALPPAEGGSPGRDPFARPRDALPLPPLPLDMPPLPALPTLAPVPEPAAWVASWGDLCRMPWTGTIAAIAEVLEAQDEGSGGEANSPAPAGNSESNVAAASPVESDPSEEYKKIYDWVRHGTLYRWGRIVNPDRFGLRERVDTVLLMEVDPKTGKPFNLKEPIRVPPPPPNVSVEIGFAKTLANEVERRARPFLVERPGPGRIAELIEAAGWCLGAADEEQDALEKAETLFDLAVVVEPVEMGGWLGKGAVLERSFRLDEAYALYKDLAENRFAHRAEPLLRRGRLEARLGLHDFAEASLRAAVRREPNSDLAHAALGDFAMLRGRPEEARSAYEDARRFEPADLAGRSRLRRGLGRARLFAGDAAGAKRAFEEALDVEPGDPEATSGAAAAAIALGDFAGAASLCERAIAAGASSFALYLDRGIARLRLVLEDPGRAAALLAGIRNDFLAAAALDPLRAARAHAALSFLYEVAGLSEEAFEANERAFEIDPTDPYVLYRRGRLFRARFDADAARQALRTAIGIELRFADALAHLGALSYAEENAEAGERYLGRAVSLAPNEPAFRALLGMNRLRGGDAGRAREVFASLLSADPGNGTARNGLAICAYRDGDLGATTRALAEVVERFRDRPEHEQAAYAAQTLARVVDHHEKVEWVDTFEGRTDLRRGWVADAIPGVSPRLADGRFRFEGTAEKAGEARLYREIAAQDFVHVLARISLGEAGQAAAAGVFVSSEVGTGDRLQTNFRIDVARRREGEVATRLRDNPKESPPWTPHADRRWPLGDPLVVTVEKAGTAEDPRLRVTLDGEIVLDDLRVREFRARTGTLRVGVFLEIEGAGRVADLSLDEVRLVYRERR